jgi:hypothetical protein
VTAIWLFQTDQATWHLILWSVGATFTGLATFGNHHDNSIAWMLICDKERLSDSFRKELEDELRHDKAGALAHQPAPYLAAFVTVLALFFQFMANYRISQVL